MLRKIPLYPFLIAIWPPLALAAKNPMEIAHLADLLPPLATGLVLSAGVYLVWWLFSRDRSRSAIATTIAVLGFWWYRELVFLVTGSPLIHGIGLNRIAPLLVLFCILGTAYVAARRLGVHLASASLTLNFFGVLLCVIPIISLSRTGIQPRLSEVIGPRPEPLQSFPSPDLPDIYILIVDSYAGQSSLLREHHFDNSAFYSALRDRRFHVPKEPRSNYLWTFLALASMLNWEYLEDGSKAPRLPALRSPEDAAPTIADNRTFRLLLEEGYELVFAPSTAWFVGEHPWAHLLLAPPLRQRGMIASHWPRMTPIPELRRLACRVFSCPRLGPWRPDSVEQLQDRLDRMVAVAATRATRPRLVFAHLMVPHYPYIFTSSCGQRSPALWVNIMEQMEASTEVEARRAYADQVKCLNDLLLRFIDSVLSHSGPQPIIILQADHGQRHGLAGFSTDDVVNPGWFDIFAAYLVPDEIAARLGEETTPIHAFRSIFGHEQARPAQTPGYTSFVSTGPDFSRFTPWAPEHQPSKDTAATSR